MLAHGLRSIGPAFGVRGFSFFRGKNSGRADGVIVSHAGNNAVEAQKVAIVAAEPHWSRQASR
jgi:hypothetical protein